MLHPILPRAIGALALLFGLAASAVADPPAPAKDDAKRLLYPVKHGAAKDLAAVLAAHFKGVAEISALPDAGTNYLLISAAPSAFNEVVQVLDQIDRPPQTVSVEILIASVSVKKGDDKSAPADDVDEKAFTGSIADVKAKVEALQKKGALGEVKRLQFTAVEGQPASLMIGENRPYVTGANIRATGAVSHDFLPQHGDEGGRHDPRSAGQGHFRGPQAGRQPYGRAGGRHPHRHGRERQADHRLGVHDGEPDEQT